MTFNQKIISYLSLFMLLLSLVSGGFMFIKSSLASTKVDNLLESPSITSGIRSIIIEEKPLAINIFKNVGLNNKPELYKSVVVKNIAVDLEQKITLVNDNINIEKVSIKKPKLDISLSLSPFLVVYNDEIIIEFPEEIATIKNIKRAVVRVLLAKKPHEEKNLLTAKAFNLKEKPYFYKKIVDQDNYSIRYPTQAYAYTDFLIQNMDKYFSYKEEGFVSVRIPLAKPSLPSKAKKYHSWVKNYSIKFKIKPSLVYAIMETESAFNPRAVSKSKAIGLMQVIANSAGKDVHNLVDRKVGKPSLGELFNPENNIRVGSAYLGLLTNNYFADVKNEKIKEMMSISSYNGGLNNVVSLFGKTSKQAIARVNRMRPKQVYNRLRFKHKFRETRHYLDKVLQADIKYKKLLNTPLERYSLKRS